MRSGDRALVIVCHWSNQAVDVAIDISRLRLGSAVRMRRLPLLQPASHVAAPSGIVHVTLPAYGGRILEVGSPMSGGGGATFGGADVILFAVTFTAALLGLAGAAWLLLFRFCPLECAPEGGYARVRSDSATEGGEADAWQPRAQRVRKRWDERGGHAAAADGDDDGDGGAPGDPEKFAMFGEGGPLDFARMAAPWLSIAPV
eukprot:PLAT7279.2.p1 GENE.PLAT7279.2~~PLAT7279.2.p1  ORF type:complete len:235 (+),score=75.71 PLAT7279.2:100-705(+)